MFLSNFNKSVDFAICSGTPSCEAKYHIDSNLPIRKHARGLTSVWLEVFLEVILKQTTILTLTLMLMLLLTVI